MPSSQISSLSVHSLKAVLFANHVNVGIILEKAELATKVRSLVEAERAERQAQAAEREAEEKREKEEQEQRLAELRAKRDARDGKPADAAPKRESGPSPSSSSPPPTEKSLCVVCQDEDANIAIVDCGHLALCRGCADDIMRTTRECPMCRTRIVTEARLLRIFKS